MAELRRKRISHVVLGDLGTTRHADSAMRRAVAESASAFSIVYRDSAFTMMALLPSAATAERTSGVPRSSARATGDGLAGRRDDTASAARRRRLAKLDDIRGASVRMTR